MKKFIVDSNLPEMVASNRSASEPEQQAVAPLMDQAGVAILSPLNEMTFGRLPLVLQRFLNLYSDPWQKEQQMLAFLGVVSSLLVGCRVLHRQKAYGPCIYVLIYGSPACGKGAVDDARTLVKDIDSEITAAFAEEHDEWAKKVRRLTILTRQRMDGKNPIGDVNDTAGEYSDLPEPSYRCLVLADDITGPMFVQTVAANQPHPSLLFTTELPALMTSLSGNFGKFQSALLKGHACETMPNLRKSAGARQVKAENPDLAIVATGVPSSAVEFLGNVETGLSSRFISFYRPFIFHREYESTIEEYLFKTDELKEIAADLKAMHDLLLTADNQLWLSLTPVQVSLIDDFINDWSDDACVDHDGTGMLANIRRHGLDVKRILLQFAVLRRMEQDGGFTLPADKCFTVSDDDVITVLQLMDRQLWQDEHLLSLLESRAVPAMEKPAKYTKKQHFCDLPLTFTTSDVINLGITHGVNKNTSYYRLISWQEKALVVSVGDQLYGKTTKGQTLAAHYLKTLSATVSVASGSSASTTSPSRSSAITRTA